MDIPFYREMHWTHASRTLLSHNMIATSASSTTATITGSASQSPSHRHPPNNTFVVCYPLIICCWVPRSIGIFIMYMIHLLPCDDSTYKNHSILHSSTGGGLSMIRYRTTSLIEKRPCTSCWMHASPLHFDRFVLNNENHHSIGGNNRREAPHPINHYIVVHTTICCYDDMRNKSGILHSSQTFELPRPILDHRETPYERTYRHLENM